LEEKCFSLSRSKTKYMKCDFSSIIQKEGMLDSMVMWYLRKTFFSYLGLMLQKDEDIDADVSHRIKVRLVKVVSNFYVLCDPSVSLNL
jgi:hypothetical protein